MQRKEWWRPEVMARRRPALIARSRILAALRGLFAEQGFIEVDTPALQVSPGLEVHLMALATELAEPLGQPPQRLYLHTSPEFAMKKLLAGGESRIYQIAHVWRDGERSPLHHPEFTLLEWYRAEATYEALMEDCALLLRRAAAASGAGEFRHGDKRCDPVATPERLTVAEAFQHYAGLDLSALMEREAMAQALSGLGLFYGKRDEWDDLFHRVMMERIEPNLGIGRATILCDYPIPLAVLARPSPRNPAIAERFELYVCGIELANGFSELTDPAIQRARFEEDIARKQAIYGLSYPIDEDFLAALAVMPEAAGIALGVDRLVILATGADTIDDVLWAPVAGGQVTGN